ncbi:hypothetical protein CR513_03272, partial [Mucuna pruriens]
MEGVSSRPKSGSVQFTIKAHRSCVRRVYVGSSSISVGSRLTSLKARKTMTNLSLRDQRSFGVVLGIGLE